MTRAICVLAVLGVVAAGCGTDSLAPAALDLGHESCGTCRMVISDTRFASQVVAPQQEPRFFDDLGCLTSYLTSHALGGARVYVADHRTKVWVSADRAVFTQVKEVSAPMGSHVIAHESSSSRDLDPDARGGSPVNARDVLGSAVGEQP
jgi:copper chaperone NosL